MRFVSWLAGHVDVGDHAHHIELNNSWFAKNMLYVQWVYGIKPESCSHCVVSEGCVLICDWFCSYAIFDVQWVMWVYVYVCVAECPLV